MIRKSHGLGLAAGAALLGLTFTSAEFSGAFAQDTDPGMAQAAEAATQDGAEAVAPQFISQEVVQPIPGEASEQFSKQGEASGERPASLRELVARIDTDLPLSEQMHCLAGAVYFEARGEPLSGQLAVAQVVINRADSARFPSSYCGVVFQRAQFSFVRNGEMPRIRKNSKAWQRAKAIARIAHEGLWESEARDALYFHAKYVSPSWSRKKVARATINQHIFYR